MSSPFSSHGYERFREFAVNTFTYLELIDDTGSPVTRIDVTTDSRVVSNPDPSTNPLKYSVEIQGSDSDIPRPVTIAETALYETDSATTAVGTDTVVDATIETEGDVVTVSHEQEIPLP